MHSKCLQTYAALGRKRKTVEELHTETTHTALHSGGSRSEKHRNDDRATGFHVTSKVFITEV